MRAATLALMCLSSEARVTRIVIDDRQPLAAAAGQTIAYEQISGRAFGDLDPRDSTNAIIQDIQLGKDADGRVRYAASFIEWYAEEAKRVYGEVLPSQFGHKRLFATKHPVGPVYAITPWNFPAAMATRKLGPALAAGCTVILKPAEQSPLTALKLAELWLEAVWNWAVTRRSSFLKTPILIAPCRMWSPASSEMRVRPAFAPTESTCSAVFSRNSPRSSPLPWPRCGLAIRSSPVRRLARWWTRRA